MARQDSTCWTLVRGAAAGDPVDRNAFAERYTPVLAAYLAARWRLAAAHDAVRDGVQEVFLQCFKERGALQRVEEDRPGGFRAWLYGVARNVAGTLEKRWHRQRRDRQESGTFVPEDVEASDAALSQVFDRSWARLVTREARELLAGRARPGSNSEARLRALELMYHEGHRAREIASELGLAAQETYQLLHKARREFRGALLEVMAGYHPGDSRAELERRCAELLSHL